jgi:hypothetical protein
LVGKYCCITEIIDHVIDQGNILYAGTTRAEDWKIYHDRLPTWWEAAAQQYIAQKGFRHRQWRAIGPDTNALLTKYYKEALFGDAPEMMCLDNCLFKHLQDGEAWHVMSTWDLPDKVPDPSDPSKHVDNPDKYSMKTPTRVWKTMMASWEHNITEELIFRDVDRLKSSMEEIVKALGCIVDDNDPRVGHRKDASRAYRKRALSAEAERAHQQMIESFEGFSGPRVRLSDADSDEEFGVSDDE